MPNQTGGKNYKKSKHASSSTKSVFIERQPDQMYARIVKNLGDRNMLVYCNDNKTRLCHIRGSMRKRIWINVGDLVLISLRSFEKTPDDDHTKQYEKGDIVAKYDEDQFGKLKKMPDINRKLFMQLETMDGKILAEIGRREAEGLALPEDQEAFEFDHGDKKKETKEEEEDDSEEDNKDFDIDDI
jgi:translation initiation factor 1A